MNRDLSLTTFVYFDAKCDEGYDCLSYDRQFANVDERDAEKERLNRVCEHYGIPVRFATYNKQTKHWE